MIIFETERLTVRRYTMEDLDQFYRLNGDEEIMRYIRPAKNLEESREFLQKILADYDSLPGLGRWALLLKKDRSFLGSFAIIPVQESPDIQLGYALLQENWGKGFASESVKAGISYSFEKLGLSSIAAITESPNTASQKVLLRNGFVFEKSFQENEKEMNFYRFVNPGKF
ncbi:MAG TPA: GNAT family N-acetyltransferase [Chitinophagaceae bacterium]|nr:GNAT family N-acetyltransferase [Chitinophagaceae bacterium]